MPSEVLAEKLYRAYVDAEKPDRHPWVGSHQRIGWIQLPWDQREQWRATAIAALDFCAHRPVEDWHGKVPS